MAETNIATLFSDNRTESFVDQIEDAYEGTVYRKMCVKFDQNFTLHIYRATNGELFEYGYHTSKRVAKEMAAEALYKKMQEFQRFMYLRSVNLIRNPVAIVPSHYIPHPFNSTFIPNPHYTGGNPNFLSPLLRSSNPDTSVAVPAIPDASLMPIDFPEDINPEVQFEEEEVDESPYPILQRLITRHGFDPPALKFFIHPGQVVAFCTLMHYITESHEATKPEARENVTYNMISLIENLSQLEIDTLRENPIERVPDTLPEWVSPSVREAFSRYQNLLKQMKKSRNPTLSQLDLLMGNPQFTAMELLNEIGREEHFVEDYSVIFEKPATSALIVEVKIYERRVNVGFGTTLDEAKEVAARGALMTIRLLRGK